jgi:hypothetical protein
MSAGHKDKVTFVCMKRMAEKHVVIVTGSALPLGLIYPT